MKIIFVYHTSNRDITDLGATFLREMKRNNDISVTPFGFLSIISNRYLNKIFNILGVNKYYTLYQNFKLLKFVLKEKPNIVFIFKGHDLLEKTLINMKSKVENIKIATYNPDDPFNKFACKENILNSIKLNDFYFIWSNRLVDKIKNEFNCNVLYSPFATDTEIIKAPKFQKFLYDVTFVGNADYERVKWIREIRDSLNRRHIDCKIEVFGKRWPNIKGVNINKGVQGLDYLNVIRHSKSSLNILRIQNKNSINMRTFEIPAAGGIMFHEYSEEAKSFFTDSDPVYFFKSSEEFVDKLIIVLENIKVVQESTKKSIKKLNNFENTYSSRIKDIVSFLKQ